MTQDQDQTNADAEELHVEPNAAQASDAGALPTGHVLNLSNDDLERLVTAAASDADFDLIGRAKAAAAELRRRAESVGDGSAGQASAAAAVERLRRRRSRLGDGSAGQVSAGQVSAAAAVERLPEIDEGVIAVTVGELPTTELEAAAAAAKTARTPHGPDDQPDESDRLQALALDALAELTLRAEGAQDARDALERLGEPLPLIPAPASTTMPQPAGVATSNLLELNGFHAVRSQVLGAVSTLESTPVEAIEAAIDYVKRTSKALEVSNEVGAREAIERADVELVAFEAARRFKRELENAATRLDARSAITAR